MSPGPRAFFLTLGVLSTALAGCVTPPDDATLAATTDLGGVVSDVVKLTPVDGLMSFAESVVSPAVGTAMDLYEPTMEVSDTGTIYVAGHVIAAATTGTPAYFSKDGGKTWKQLPFLASASAPSPVQGSQPPPGDEGVIVAGANGQAWMADIYLAGYSITGWCEDGARQCYDNRNAYDRVTSTQGDAKCRLSEPAFKVSANDRPWAAYADGTLLLVNNPGGGPMQIGVMQVPPSAPVGLSPASGPKWNTCASPGGFIPGIPGMRADGLFAVPQMNTVDGEQRLTLTLGNKADISKVETKEVFPVTSAGGGTLNGGLAAFDSDGTLFAAARNNTGERQPGAGGPLGGGTRIVAKEGRLVLAASTDGGATFRNATFASPSGRPVLTLVMDAIPTAKGALLSWAEAGDQNGKLDWYVAHVNVGATGAPEVTNVVLAIDEGPMFTGDVMGAAVGPDGRAYFLTFKGNIAGGPGYSGSAPISVWIQQDGPTLPVDALPTP